MPVKPQYNPAYRNPYRVPVMSTVPGGIPLPQVPMWTPPFVPGAEGSGQPSPAPTMPQQQIPQQMPQQQLPSGIMGKLKDPRLAGWLMTVGSMMGQPRQVGQTGWGQAAQAMAQGYNYLAMNAELQRQRQLQEWQMQRQTQMDQMTMDKTRGDITAQQAGTTNEGKRIGILEQQVKGEQANREALLKLQRDELKANIGKSAEQLALQRDSLNAEIRQKDAQLREMQAKRANEKTITEAQLDIQRAKVKLDAVEVAARMMSAKAGANRDDATAEAIRQGKYPNGGTGGTGSLGIDTLEAQRVNQIRSSIRAQVSQEAVMNKSFPNDKDGSQQQAWIEQEVERRFQQAVGNPMVSRPGTTTIQPQGAQLQPGQVGAPPPSPTGGNPAVQVTQPPPDIVRRAKPGQPIYGPGGSVWVKDAQGQVKQIQ